MGADKIWRRQSPPSFAFDISLPETYLPAHRLIRSPRHPSVDSKLPFIVYSRADHPTRHESP